MQEWKKTTCVMCAVCCGLEVEVEDNRVVKVRHLMTNEFMIDCGIS